MAQTLSSTVVSVPAFEEMTEVYFAQAARLLRQCAAVIDAGTPLGKLNDGNGKLLKLAREEGIPVTKWNKMTAC